MVKNIKVSLLKVYGGSSGMASLILNLSTR
jgi:hypothetical protein